MSRRLTLILLSAAFAAALLAAATAPARGDVADEAIIQLSEDTFINPTSQHRTEVEPDTFAFGSTWVSTFQAGRFTGAGASGIGFASSSDQGHSFVQGFLPSVTVFSDPPGEYDRASDPTVAFDGRHRVWLISFIGIHGGVRDILVSRSPDAVHWDAPVPVARLGANLDKNWTVCDNSPPSLFYGNCYTEFNGPGPSFLLYMTTSTDGGATWGAPVVAGNGNAGQPLAQPSGRVVVPYFGLCAGAQQMCSVTSDDGGATWESPVVISTRTIHPTMPLLQSPPLASAEIDREGRIYLVWKDCRFEPECFTNRNVSTNDLVLSTSDDGLTWTTPQRIPLDPIGSKVDHFLPGIGVDPVSSGNEARLALTYYYVPESTDYNTIESNCTLETCGLFVGYVSSTDGGQTWSEPKVLAGRMQLSWLAQTDTGRMVGDYISTSVPNGGALALPAFAVALPPDEDGTLHEAIYTARVGIRGEGKGFR
jgi:hypothetical protein